MNGQRHHISLVCAVAWSLLLQSCAAPAAAAGGGMTRSGRQPLPGFWWYEKVGVDTLHPNVEGKGRRIAILDTGVRRSHEDLPHPVYALATCGTDPNDVDDRRGHGTQLAGIAVGQDRGHATRGVAPAADLVVIKIDCGVVTAEALTQGVDAAISATPDVVLLALGGYPPGASYVTPDGTQFPDVSSFLLDRIEHKNEILFVVASVWDDDKYPRPPWAQLPNVVVVAPMTLDDHAKEVAYSAKRGDLWAPGKDVQTASIDRLPGSNFHDSYSMQGASPAAAIVAGCALLVKQDNSFPAQTAGQDLRKALTTNADPSPGRAHGSRVRNGRVNCKNAVSPPHP